MVFQGAALFDSLSVADNVAYGLRVDGRRGMRPDAVAERPDVTARDGATDTATTGDGAGGGPDGCRSRPWNPRP